MGKRGPKKTPTPVLKLRGSWRAKERPEEVQPGGAVGSAPDWLNEDGKSKWSEISEVLQPLGLLTAADRDALIRYCEAWQDYRDAIRAIEEHGAEVFGMKGGLVANPAIHRKQHADKRMQQIGACFGLNPSARADLGAKPQKQGPDKSKFFKKQA